MEAKDFELPIQRDRTVIDICTFKWTQHGYRSKYGPQQVNTLRNMVKRNYNKPHRFVCITDDPTGIDPDIRIVPLWDDYRNLPNPSFKNGPSCFRRLKMFSREAAEFIGPRFACIDLDVVVTGDLSPIFDRQEDFVIWGDTFPGYWYNGSLWVMTAGSRAKVWETFDPHKSPKIANAAGRKGSDQGWISHCLGKGEKVFNVNDGIYSYNNHIKKMSGKLPENARIVIFHGVHDPWHDDIQRKHQWVKENYR
jgi:hypothetical protein